MKFSTWIGCLWADIKRKKEKEKRAMKFSTWIGCLRADIKRKKKKKKSCEV
jgi:hypothetical protein